MSRNIVDSDLNETNVSLPTADGTSYSSDIDLGADEFKGENYELFISIPSLTATHLPNADTLTVNICAGASASPTAVILGSVLVMTGAGGTGAAAKSARVRLPSDCSRYVRVQFIAAGGTGDMSAVDAEVGLRF